MKKLLSALLSVLLLSSLTGCLSNNYENGELYIYLPGEYLSDEVVEQFEYEYGVKVYVNFGYTDAEVDGMTIPARSYLTAKEAIE